MGPNVNSATMVSTIDEQKVSQSKTNELPEADDNAECGNVSSWVPPEEVSHTKAGLLGLGRTTLQKVVQLC